MKVLLKELLDKLGVGYVLSPYETCPWSVHDDKEKATCSAEVRMDGSLKELEVEIQIVPDGQEDDNMTIKQVMWMLCKIVVGEKWSPVKVRIEGVEDPESLGGWEEKACNFFGACVQELKMNRFPDIEEILDRELAESESTTTMRGGGSKSPKIKPQKLLGIKQGRGF